MYYHDNFIKPQTSFLLLRPTFFIKKGLIYTILNCTRVITNKALSHLLNFLKWFRTNIAIFYKVSDVCATQLKKSILFYTKSNQECHGVLNNILYDS